MRYVGDCSGSSRNERQRYFLQQFILQKGHYLIFEPWKLDREGMHEAAQTMYTTMDTTDFTRLMQKLTSGSYSIETDGVLPQPLKWDTFRQNGEQYIFIPDAFPSLIEQTKNELGMQ